MSTVEAIVEAITEATVKAVYERFDADTSSPPSDPAEREERRRKARAAAGRNPIRREAAYHEAGHVVAAIRAGGRINRADIFPRDGMMGEADVRVDGDLIGECAMLIAGPLAATRFAGAEFKFRTSTHPDNFKSDRDMVIDLLRDHHNPYAIMNAATTRASEIVEADAKAIEAIAERLMEDGELWRMELLQIFAEAA